MQLAGSKFKKQEKKERKICKMMLMFPAVSRLSQWNLSEEILKRSVTPVSMCDTKKHLFVFYLNSFL